MIAVLLEQLELSCCKSDRAYASWRIVRISGDTKDKKMYTREEVRSYVRLIICRPGVLSTSHGVLKPLRLMLYLVLMDNNC